MDLEPLACEDGVNLVKEGKGGLLPASLQGWPLEFVQHVAEATCVSPSPAGPPSSCMSSVPSPPAESEFILDMPNRCCILELRANQCCVCNFLCVPRCQCQNKMAPKKTARNIIEICRPQSKLSVIVIPKYRTEPDPSSVCVMSSQIVFDSRRGAESPLLNDI